MAVEHFESSVNFPDSVISAGNSTNTPLGADAVFTGAWEEVKIYSGITAIILTDQASATNGAVVQFSDDGVTVLRSVAATIPADVGLSFVIGPEARYVRIIYTNGPIAQTFIRAQVIYHFQPPVPAQLPLAATTTDISLAQSALSHLKGRYSSGVWLPVAVTSAGKLIVDTGLIQPTTPSDTQPISASSLPLPSGAATETTLDSLNTKVTLDADTGINVHVVNPLSQSGLNTADFGQVDVSTTQVAVPTTADSKTVAVGALSANVENIYVAKTGVTSMTGWELPPGAAIEIDVSDAVPLFVIAASGTQRFCYAKVA